MVNAHLWQEFSREQNSGLQPGLGLPNDLGFSISTLSELKNGNRWYRTRDVRQAFGTLLQEATVNYSLKNPGRYIYSGALEMSYGLLIQHQMFGGLSEEILTIRGLIFFEGHLSK